MQAMQHTLTIESYLVFILTVSDSTLYLNDLNSIMLSPYQQLKLSLLHLGKHENIFSDYKEAFQNLSY